MEYERKYLVDPAREFGVQGLPCEIYQGYIAIDELAEVRVRILTDAMMQKSATLCVKERRLGAVRKEYELDVPVCDAEEMLELASNRILQKKRWKWDGGDGGEWILDVFEGRLHGLVLAEWECSTSEAVLRGPSMLSKSIVREVTEDPHFRNHYLATADGLTVASLVGSRAV